MTAGGSSIPEVQALLTTLAAAKPGGRVAETGTAYGAGARAIAAAMDGESSFVTVEVDPDRYRQTLPSSPEHERKSSTGAGRTCCRSARRSIWCSPTVTYARRAASVS